MGDAKWLAIVKGAVVERIVQKESLFEAVAG